MLCSQKPLLIALLYTEFPKMYSLRQHEKDNKKEPCIEFCKYAWLYYKFVLVFFCIFAIFGLELINGLLFGFYVVCLYS